MKTLSGRHGRVAGEGVDVTLDIWDAQLAALGAELVAARLATLAELAPLLASAYADIAPTNNLAVATYKSSAFRRHRRNRSRPTSLSRPRRP